MSVVRITPVTGPARGAVTLPGSKSMTNRALLLAALARGRSTLSGALSSDDTERMREALGRMGVAIEAPDPTTFRIEGSGALSPASVFLGNAGTATRFLTAAAAIAPGESVIDGDAHMRKRPIGPLLDALRGQGIEAISPTGAPPVTIRSRGALAGGRIEVDAGLSSQYVSALMMIAPKARAPVDIALAGAEGALDAAGYVDLTIEAMAAFGVAVERRSSGRWRIEPAAYRAIDYAVPPDASAATYFWALAALTGGAIELGLDAASCSQPDARSKASIDLFPELPAVIDGAQMQDSVPTLAVLAAFAARPVRFTGIANLRVKECDRISALAEGLNAIAPGAAGEDGDDLCVDPGVVRATPPRPCSIDTKDDHRIAMSFALAACMREGVTIENPACTAKTFPDFWDRLTEIGVGSRFCEV